MQSGDSDRGTKFGGLLPFVVGVAVFIGVALVLPGSGCADGWSSPSIGRPGACSHHGGVTSGWAFLGVPLGLLAGMLTARLMEDQAARRRASEERAVESAWAEAKASDKGISLRPTIDPGEDRQEALRRVIGTGWWVAFTYRQGAGRGTRSHVAQPLWIQKADFDGERKVCVIAFCSKSGRTPFALDHMSDLAVVRRQDFE